MKVGLVNQVGFRAAESQIRNEKSENSEVASLKEILTDDLSWAKVYSPEKDEVFIQNKIATDMGTYTIQNDGTVISGVNLGESKPSIVLEKNKYMADYVKNLKEHNEILDKITSDVAFTSKDQKVNENNDIEAVAGVKKTKSARDGIAGVWKFMTVANQMANSALKGLLYGALTGVALLSGSWVFKALPKAFTKEGPTLWNTIRHPLKNIGKSGKIIAGIGSATVLGYQLVAGKLAANQKTAVIDHKLKTGHRDK